MAKATYELGFADKFDKVIINDDLEKAEPVLKTFKGWKKPLGGVRSKAELPTECLDYLNFIEEFTGTPISIISVGPDRDQTFNAEDPWTK